ncbi:hypothetical protein [Pectobacterium polaris]
MQQLFGKTFRQPGDKGSTNIRNTVVSSVHLSGKATPDSVTGHQ